MPIFSILDSRVRYPAYIARSPMGMVSSPSTIAVQAPRVVGLILRVTAVMIIRVLAVNVTVLHA